jgi:Rieske Fe-S protein
MKKNIYIIFLIFLFVSCESDKKYTNIPDSYVNIQINLLNYTTFKNGIGNYLICPDDLISSHTSSGFGYANGIVLCHNSLDEFLAFDMCCTNPYCVEHKIRTTINLASGRAECSYCGSVFNLIIGYGDVIIGPAKYPLRLYKTTINGDLLRVARIN